MGSFIVPLLVDVMVNYVADKAVKSMRLDHQLKFFCCYVDNSFATFTNASSIDLFFVILTVEQSNLVYQEVEMHSSLSFCDVLIKKGLDSLDSKESLQIVFIQVTLPRKYLSPH